jgi:uncharacterized protein (DUF779 family)
MTVTFTPAALAVVERVRASRGPVAWRFVFGEGCCEGTAPHLFAEPHVGPTQHEVGRAGDIPVFADDRLIGLYKDRGLLVDVDEDPLADGFSAEVALGYRFKLAANR